MSPAGEGISARALEVYHMCGGDYLQFLFDYIDLKAFDFKNLILKTSYYKLHYIHESKTNNILLKVY